MSDDRLRELERRYKESGLPADEAAWLQERLRCGELAKLDLRMDAVRGSPAARLALSDSRGLDRWDRFQELVARWYERPIRPADGASEDEVDAVEERLDLELPLVLWEFHRLVGRRLGDFVQDPIFKLGSLSVEDGVLWVSGENQGCWGCGVRVEDLEQDDPSVWLSAPGVEPGSVASAFEASDSLAEFLQMLVLRDTVLGAELEGLGPLGRRARDSMGQEVHLGPGGHERVEATFDDVVPLVCGFAMRVVGDEDRLLLLEYPDQRGLLAQESAWGLALSREAWLDLCEVVGMSWEDEEPED